MQQTINGMTIIPPTVTGHPMYQQQQPYLPTTMNAGAGAVDPYFQLLQQQRQQEAHDASKTLFLGDLSYFCTEENLCTLFVPYGRIITVRVRRGVTGESLMHGFIALDSHEAAVKAIHDLDGAEFMGRNMRVQLSSDGQRPSPINKETFVQIHVSFISKQLQMLVTEKVLRDIFGPFGRIADVTIKKHTMIQKQNRQSGYGFVYYFDVAAANHAMSVLKQNTIMDITLDCSISYKSQHDKTPSRHNSGNWDMSSVDPYFDAQQSLYASSGSAHTSPGVSRSPSMYRTNSTESISGAAMGLGSLSRPGSGRFNVSNGLPMPPQHNTSARIATSMVDPYGRSPLPSPQMIPSPMSGQNQMRRPLSGGQEIFYGDELEADLNRLSLRSQSTGYSGMTSLNNSASTDYINSSSGSGRYGAPQMSPNMPPPSPRMLINPHSRTSSAHNLLQQQGLMMPGPSPVASLSAASYDHFASATPGIGIGMMNSGSEYDESNIALMRTVSEQQNLIIRQNHAYLMQQQNQMLAQQQVVEQQAMMMERRGLISRPDSDLSVASSGSARMNSFGSHSSSGSGFVASATPSPQHMHPASAQQMRIRQLQAASQYESFYGEPIASVSLNSSGYMNDLDSLLGMPTTGIAAPSAGVVDSESPFSDSGSQGFVKETSSGGASASAGAEKELNFSWDQLEIREETEVSGNHDFVSDTSSN